MKIGYAQQPLPHQEAITCLDPASIKELVDLHNLFSPPLLIKNIRDSQEKNTIIRLDLCRKKDYLFYKVTFLSNEGKVFELLFDGKTSKYIDFNKI